MFAKGDRVTVANNQLPKNSERYPDRENGVVSREPTGQSKYIWVRKNGQTADEQYHPSLWKLSV